VEAEVFHVGPLRLQIDDDFLAFRVELDREAMGRRLRTLAAGEGKQQLVAYLDGETRLRGVGRGLDLIDRDRAQRRPQARLTAQRMLAVHRLEAAGEQRRQSADGGEPAGKAPGGAVFMPRHSRSYSGQ